MCGVEVRTLLHAIQNCIHANSVWCGTSIFWLNKIWIKFQVCCWIFYWCCRFGFCSCF